MLSSDLENQGSGRRLPKLLLGGVALFIIVLLVFIGTKFFFAPKPFDTLSGTIYLTTSPGKDTATDLYKFDVATRRFSLMLPDDFIKLTGKFSPDGGKLAFVSAPLDRSSPFFLPSREFLQVKVYDMATKTVTQLTNNANFNKRIGDWSPDGQRIVFTSQPVKTAEEMEAGFYNPNSWSIDTVDMNGDVRYIDMGDHPLWSRDGAYVLFLKKDGLYRYAFSENKAMKVYDLPDESGRTNMKLGLSPDGTRLAWTIADKNQLYLFTISSWDPFLLKVIRQIDTKDKIAFWPVFSPDGRYVVFQSADQAITPLLPEHPSLEVYDIETEQYLKLADLDQYNFQVSFVDDWR